MAITISDKKKIRLVTDVDQDGGVRIPGLLASAAITNPGPIAVDSTQDALSGNTLCVQATAALRGGYIGYNVSPDVVAGNALSTFRNVTLEGFAGMTPGAAVYVGTSSADSSSTASGLTHTIPITDAETGSSSEQINGGTVSATGSFEFVVPPGATNLTGISFVVQTTVATDDTNYWTITAVNKGSSGAGSTALLATTDANTNKATGGTAFTAHDERNLTVHGTAGNLAVSPGDVILVTFTKTASAANLVGITVKVAFETEIPAVIQQPIGVALTTTKLRIH